MRLATIYSETVLQGRWARSVVREAIRTLTDHCRHTTSLRMRSTEIWLFLDVVFGWEAGTVQDLFYADGPASHDVRAAFIRDIAPVFPAWCDLLPHVATAICLKTGSMVSKSQYLLGKPHLRYDWKTGELRQYVEPWVFTVSHLSSVYPIALSMVNYAR